MRRLIIFSLIASLLSGSVEGMAEPVDETSFHQTHHTHVDDGQQWYPDSVGGDHEAEACDHFCHVHVVALTPQVSALDLPRSRGLVNVASVRTAHRSTAPPTPPPNF